MKDQSFNIYSEQNVWLYGDVRDGVLSLTSEVYGPGYGSERHYIFTREETEKLFALCSLGEFIELCRRERLAGMEDFLRENGIGFGTCTI